MAALVRLSVPRGGLGVASPVRLSALVAALVMTAAMTGYRYARRLGGVTGDFLGATEQLAEIAALAALAWGR